jgi:hypothetical protein
LAAEAKLLEHESCQTSFSAEPILADGLRKDLPAGNQTPQNLLEHAGFAAGIMPHALQ